MTKEENGRLYFDLNVFISTSEEITERDIVVKIMNALSSDGATIVISPDAPHSLGFAEWVTKNRYTDYGRGGKNWHRIGSQRKYTLDELYTIFKNQK